MDCSIVARRKFRIRSFGQDQQGTVAILFGLMALSIFGIIGMAIDYSRAYSERSHLQKTADSVATSVASAAAFEAMEQSELEAFAASMFTANYNGMAGGSISPIVNIVDGLVKVTTNYSVPTTISTVLGFDTISVSTHSEAVIPAMMKAEIVLVLDYSGSMDSAGKYDAMRDASIKLIDDLYQNGANPNLKFGLVPFSDHIYLSLPGNYVVGQDPSGSWTNCLQDRPYPHNTLNDEPISSDDTTKWTSGAPVDNGGSGSGVCPEYLSRNLVVAPLTDNITSIKSQLSSMTPYANTHIALGMAMGWHLISPAAPFTEAADYTEEETKKFIILLTDGRQTENAKGPAGSLSVADGELNLVTLCENAKNANINVVTVAFDLQDLPTRNRLENCASSTSYFFEAETNSDLAAVFAEITGKLAGEIKLVK